MNIIHKHLNEIDPMSEERAKELETLPDEDIDYSEIPPLDETFFKTAKEELFREMRGKVKYYEDLTTPTLEEWTEV